MSPRVPLEKSKPAERLEYVRRNAGVETLKDFWEEISKILDVSYEAARNYHTHREPPAQYYAAVAERFGVRLEWLIRGGLGPVYQLDWEQQRLWEKGARENSWPFYDGQAWEALGEDGRWVAKLRPATLKMFEEAWRRTSDTQGAVGDYNRVLGQQLLGYIKLPLAWAECEIEPDGAGLDRYVEAMLHALNLGLDLSP